MLEWEEGQHAPYTPVQPLLKPNYHIVLKYTERWQPNSRNTCVNMQINKDQCSQNFFARRTLLASKVTTDPHILAHTR